MSKTRKAVVAAIATVAALITICSFALGISSLPQLFKDSGTSAAATVELPYTDSLLSPSPGWSNDDRCGFQNDGYHVQNAICYAPVGSLGDVEVSVEGRTLKDDQGHESWGVDVRATNSDPIAIEYSYVIFSTGTLAFVVCAGSNQPCTELWSRTTGTPVHTGYGVINSLGIIAKGSNFSLYCNGQGVADLDDSTLSQGLVGIESGDSAEVVFTDIGITRP